MEWNEQVPEAPGTVPVRAPGRFRRGVATALLAAGLLSVGGVAAVAAASPDASASPPPQTTQPSDDGTTAPSERSDPDTDRAGRWAGHNCPADGTDDSTDGSSSDDSTDGSTDASGASA